MTVFQLKFLAIGLYAICLIFLPSIGMSQSIDPDDYEDDDGFSQASIIGLNSDLGPQRHSFHDAGDVDWVKFYGISGNTYTIEVNHAGSACDAYIEVYDASGSIIKEADLGIAGDDERLDWVSTKDGIYYVKIRQYDPDVYGLNTGYDLQIYRPIGCLSGTVHGIISDSSTAETVNGALIRTDENDTAMSLSDGTYRLETCLSSRAIMVNSIRYKDYTETIDLTFGEDLNRDLSIVPIENTDEQHYGNLVLVAGGGVEASNTLKESTQYLSDLVYRRYFKRFFTHDDIFYFNPISWHDIDGDGQADEIVDDDSPTVAEFGQSITEWAAGRSTDGPLYIYLIDHGGIDTFKIYPGEILSAAQLKSFIDIFQQNTGRMVVTMIEACKSGSFNDDLVTQGQNRISVTCTDDQDAYLQLNGRISFTQFFVDRLLTGDNINKGWLKARNQLANMGVPYSRMTPQLVEGVSLASTQVVLGGDYAIAGLFPVISGQSPNKSIPINTTQAFYAVIEDGLEGIESVWASVVPPGYVVPEIAPDGETPLVDLPTFTLADPDKDLRYEGIYSDFENAGEYRITFYARNKNGNVSEPPSATIVTVMRGTPGDINGDDNVDLTDAILSLKVTVGLDSSQEISSGGDVNGDGKIGLKDALYILQQIAGRAK